MKIKSNLKGYFYAIIAVFAMANVYIFSKAALQEISIKQFGFYWFAFAFVWIILFALYKKTLPTLFSLPKKYYFILLILGILDVIGTYFFYKAIQVVPNPSIVAFIWNISPAFVIFLSILIFKERFNLLETVGILLALIGAFIISYQGNTNFKSMFIYGTQFTVISSLISAVMAIIIKHNIAMLNPIVLNINRIFFLLTFFTLTFNWKQDSIHISNTALKNIFIGSFIGPFLAGVAGYMAYQYIPVSRKAIIDSFRGLMVLVGAYFYFGKFPERIAVVGGVISIVGVLFIAFGKLKLKEKA